VLGRRADLPRIAHDGVIVGVGDNSRRSLLFADLCAVGETLITAVHPTAVISAGARLGMGTLVCAQAVVGTSVHVGANVVINALALLGHHTVVANHAHIGPGAHLGGEIKVGEGVLVGLGANVMSRRHLGAWCRVGAGALVDKEVAPGNLVVGVPARSRPQREEESAYSVAESAIDGSNTEISSL
jgi:sugar O-acyltransferase (sialic acid O-acetyltransferase NeuD family)